VKILVSFILLLSSIESMGSKNSTILQKKPLVKPWSLKWNRGFKDVGEDYSLSVTRFFDTHWGLTLGYTSGNREYRRDNIIYVGNGKSIVLGTVTEGLDFQDLYYLASYRKKTKYFSLESVTYSLGVFNSWTSGSPSNEFSVQTSRGLMIEIDFHIPLTPQSDWATLNFGYSLRYGLESVIVNSNHPNYGDSSFNFGIGAVL